MANIISINWNEENSRRLNGSQAQPNDAELPTLKVVDVVRLEIKPLPVKREEPLYAPPLPKTAQFVGLTVSTGPVTAETKETPKLKASGSAFKSGPDNVNPGQYQPGDGPSDLIEDLFSTAAATPVVRSGERIDLVARCNINPSEKTTDFIPQMSSIIAPGQAVLPPPSHSSQDMTVGLHDDAKAPAHSISCQYRGVEYWMAKSAFGGRWRWSLRVGQPKMLRMGEATTEQQAEFDLRGIIDRAVAVEQNLSRLKKPGSPS